MSDSENTCTCVVGWSKNRYVVVKCPLCQQAPALLAENERLCVVIQTMLDALIVAEQRLSSDLSKTIKSQCCAAIELAAKTLEAKDE